MQSLKSQMAPGLWWTGKLVGHHKVVTWTMRRCSWPSTVKRGAELLPMANRFAPGSIMLRTILPLSHGIFPTVRHLRGCFQRWPQSRYMLISLNGFAHAERKASEGYGTTSEADDKSDRRVFSVRDRVVFAARPCPHCCDHGASQRRGQLVAAID